MSDAYFWIKISLENAAQPFNFQTRMSFKKCQVAKKLKTISRTNFLESCSTFIMLTNTPYHNPSNRSTIFFWVDWKKSLIFWKCQKFTHFTKVRFFNTCWPRTQVNFKISTFSHNTIFPLLPNLISSNFSKQALETNPFQPKHTTASFFTKWPTPIFGSKSALKILLSPSIFKLACPSKNAK